MTLRNLVRRILTCPVCDARYMPDNGEVCECAEVETEDASYANDRTLYVGRTHGIADRDEDEY